MTTSSEDPAQFPLYLVVAYNNLDALLVEYSASGDLRLLREALLISCRDLKRLRRDTDFWRTARQALARPQGGEDRVGDGLRAFNIDQFLTMESELLMRADVRPAAVDRLVQKVASAATRVQTKDAPRFPRRLRGRIDDLADQACKRFSALLNRDGWPGESQDRSGHITVVRCFDVVGGAVVAGADVFGALHVPVTAPLAKESVKIGVDMIEHGLTRTDPDPK
jgi:hypothetical protein